MQTLWADLKKFVSANIGWIHKACAVLLSDRNLKVNDYVNQLIEPHFSFDEVAITIVCKMYNVHCLVLCNQTYWTTRSHANYADCVVKLAYFGNGLFKEIIPQIGKKTVYMGVSAKDSIPVVDHDKTSQNPLSSDLDLPHSEEVNCDRDQHEQDMDQDLHGTGIISDEELPFENVPEIVDNNVQKPVPETDHSYSTHEDPAGPTETVSPPEHDTVDPSNVASLANSESLLNNTDQNGSTNDACASENIESDTQPAVQNGCVQSESTEPVQGGSSNIPLQEGGKRDSLRQSIAVCEQNYDES